MASVSVSDSIFIGNSASIYRRRDLQLWRGLSVSGSRIQRQQRDIWGGAIDNWTEGERKLSATVIFSGNSAERDGGAIHNIGPSCSVSVRDSEFSGNSAEYAGGAIFNDEGSGSVSDSEFQRQ